MRKRILYFVTAIGLLFSMAACGNSGQNDTKNAPAENQAAAPAEESVDDSTEIAGENTESNTAAEDTADAAGGNILIAYFSVMETDGVDTVAGASRVAVNGEVLGNNQYIAQIIRQEIGGDLFAIETVQEYPTTHEPLLEFAYKEKAGNARPELATQIEDPDRYDVIFLGFPKMEYGFDCVLCASYSEKDTKRNSMHKRQ